ncbi:MAG: hypothetical protein HY244_06225 [Rhizobiales bacterium]|nr:hypothetical protein [Hyphomicrobiales bacterium]
MDVIQHLLGRRVGLGQTLHVVDELAAVHCALEALFQPESVHAHNRYAEDALSGNSPLM